MSMKDFRSSRKTITKRTGESVSRYFREVSRIPLLTMDEEAELARTIRRGGIEGEIARDRLITANLRFVISVANSYKTNGALEFADLISEGNIGLMKAVDRFDETRGFLFCSYAVWWIRQSIADALAKHGNTMRIPLNQQTIVHQYRQMQQDMFLAEQRPITIDEFCAVSGYDYDRVVSAIESSAKVIKLDDPLSDDTDTTYGDLLPSGSSADSDLDHDSLHHDLRKAIDKLLSDREVTIIAGHFGIGCNEMSLDDLAYELNLSRERTRQICISAINKIRNSPYASSLRLHLAA